MTRLAVFQAASCAGDADAALAALVAPLRAAGAAGAAVLVAPEAWLPGYNSDRIAAQAQPRGGPWHAALRAACRNAGCGLAVGYAERDGARVYNATVVFGADGAEVGHYRKVQLYGAREKAIYTAGDAYALVQLGGMTAGVLICYDVEFDVHVAALAAKGAHVILAPTANMAPFAHVVRATVPAMAANHGVAIAYANYCGVEGDLTYVGGSLIAGPHGEVLAQAGDHPALLIVDVPGRDVLRASTQATDLRRI